MRKESACNILFKNAIIKAHQIQFNESLDIYADTSFVLEYLKYAERFVRITNFPFYYRGEVYDPFYGNTLLIKILQINLKIMLIVSLMLCKERMISELKFPHSTNEK